VIYSSLLPYAPTEGQMPEKPWEDATSTGYRVIRYLDEDDAWLVVHKVYYDQQGNPIAIDFGVADIDGDTVDELIFTAGRKCPPCGGAPEPPDRLAGRGPAER